jgi:hypothetical protein
MAYIDITTRPPSIDSRNESAFVLRVSGMPQNFTTAAYIEVSEPVPESFMTGWADYQAGRVVDMERALGDEPPPPPR